MSALVVSLVTSSINSLLVSPVILPAMLHTFQTEVDAGYSDVIGYAHMTSLEQNPAYLASYRKFRRFHGISAMMVTSSLVANCVHLYVIATTSPI